MFLCTVCVCYQLLFILTKAVVQSIPLKGADKTTEQSLDTGDLSKTFENIPTYIKQLYGIVSKGKRPDLMHNGDSVRSYSDEGRKKILFFFVFRLRGYRNCHFIFVKLVSRILVSNFQRVRQNFESVNGNSCHLTPHKMISGVLSF